MLCCAFCVPSTRRHPAHPVSVLILHPTIIDMYKLCGYKLQQRYYIVKLSGEYEYVQTCNSLPSYWIRQAQHRNAGNPGDTFDIERLPSTILGTTNCGREYISFYCLEFDIDVKRAL